MTRQPNNPVTGSQPRLPAFPSRRGFLTLAGAVGGIMLVGCSSQGRASGAPDSASTGLSGGTPIKGGTLNMAFLGSIESLDPHFNHTFAATNFTNNIVDRLTFQDPSTGQLSPWLATKWTANDKLTEFTFTLRNDVTFSDGSKFTAASVKNNLDQFVNGDTAKAILPEGSYMPGYKETQVLSDYVVKVTFSTPVASFLQLTATSGSGGTGFLSDRTLSYSASERLKPENVSGTGPFTVSEYVPNERAVLVRRPDYKWGPAAFGHTGPAYLDKVVFLTVPDASVRVGSLESGTVQAAYDIIPTDEKVLSAAGYSLTSRVVPGFPFNWVFNFSLPQTADINVRRAIVAATDRATFKKSLLAPSEGEARSTLTANTPGFVDYSKTALEYDLDHAKKLLDDGGWTVGADGIREKDGVKLNLKATSNILLPDAQVTLTALQATLKSIGINISILVDTTNVPTSTINTQYHLIAGNLGRDDPAVLNTRLNPELGGAFGNGNLIPSDFPGRAKIVQTLSALETTEDPSQLDEVAKAAQDLILQEYVLVNPIFETSQVAATKVVHDIYQDACTRLLFAGAWISKT